MQVISTLRTKTFRQPLNPLSLYNESNKRTEVAVYHDHVFFTKKKFQIQKARRQRVPGSGDAGCANEKQALLMTSPPEGIDQRACA